MVLKIITCSSAPGLAGFEALEQHTTKKTHNLSLPTCSVTDKNGNALQK